MIYFSELKGRKIVTQSQKEVGKLEDLVFLAQEIPQITKIFIKFKKGNPCLIPLDQVQKINSRIIVNNDYHRVELEENELYILKNLIDKQIIDLTGNKIVKVNDALLQLQKEGLSLLMGVEIGFLGILRWLKLEKPITLISHLFGIDLKSPFLSWKDIQPLELNRGHVKLKKKETKMTTLLAADLADYLEKTSIANAEKLLATFNAKYAAQVLNNLNLNYQVDIFNKLPTNKAAELLCQIDPDEIVDVLLALNRYKREVLLALLPYKLKLQVTHLINLAKTPIGNLLTSQFLTVTPHTTVKETLDRIKKETQDFSVFNYVYVINDKKCLVGVFNLHELLMEDLTTPVYKFMRQNLIVIHLTTPEEIVLKKMVKYQLYSLPVIDKNKRLLGLLSYDNLTKDIMKL